MCSLLGMYLDEIFEPNMSRRKNPVKVKVEKKGETRCLIVADESYVIFHPKLGPSTLAEIKLKMGNNAS